MYIIHVQYVDQITYECVHSMRIAFAKLILVSTRITYEATGDAGMFIKIRYATKQA